MIICPECQYENRDDARFCSQCGFSFAAPPAAEPAPPPAPASPPVEPSAEGPAPPEPLPSEDDLTDTLLTPTESDQEDETWLLANPEPAPSEADLTDTLLTPTTSSQADATGPLTPPPPLFAPLPKGAILDGGRYLVLEDQSSGSDRNVYLIESKEPRLECPNPSCLFQENFPGEEYCVQCGASLGGVSPTHPHFLLKESLESTTFSNQREIAGLKLSHPGLVCPQDYFEETPYGKMRRYYLVEPETRLRPAIELPIPQEVEGVLDGGVQLAGALDYLHRHNVVHQKIDLHHIAFDDDNRARLTNFHVADVIPPAGRADLAPKRYAEDIQMLAGSLYYLLTGQTTLTPGANLPPEVMAIFTKALAPTAEVGYSTARELADDLERVLKGIRRPASVDLRVGRLTDVGQVRHLNEDSLLTLERCRICESLSQPIGLYVVADGMGGHSAGEVASGMAIEIMEKRMVSYVLTIDTVQEGLDYSSWLEEVFREINQMVFAHKVAAHSDMGTTLVAALVVGATAYIANVGDSRAYLIGEEGLTQITIDHSLVERLLSLGQLTPEEARYHPQRNVIYRSIGNKPEIEVDVFVQALNVGDRLLLCSDGLNGMVTDDEIERIVRASLHPQEACQQLVQAANANGGGDNITVIVVQVEAA